MPFVLFGKRSKRTLTDENLDLLLERAIGGTPVDEFAYFEAQLKIFFLREKFLQFRSRFFK